MPKKEIDYSKCLIYKIQHKDNNDLLYVGHTTNFTKRKNNHKTNVNYEKGNAYNHKVYQMIRENGGWDNFNMVIIKEFPCQNLREAEAEEDKAMREMKSTMNTIRAFRSREEWCEDNKEKLQEYRHQYYQDNKEYKQEQQNQYYQDNKEKLQEHHREYREKNKEKLKEQKHQYYQEHKNKVCLCECGKTYTHHHKLRHEKSQFHLNFICSDTDPPSSSQPEFVSS